MEKKICIGLFKGSQGEDGIQLSADVYGLIELQDRFRSLANGMDRFNFSDLQLLENKSGIDLVAYSHPINVGLKHTGNGTYEWRVTKEKWNEFKEKLLMICFPVSEKNIQLESGAADKDDVQVAFLFDEFQQF